MRYRLQYKEPYTYWDRTGKPVPVHTYRWVDIAVADDLEALVEYAGEMSEDYRIIDTNDCDRVIHGHRANFGPAK